MQRTVTVQGVLADRFDAKQVAGSLIPETDIVVDVRARKSGIPKTPGK